MKTTPLMIDLCEICDKPFWVERGHTGTLHCPYCGEGIATFGDKK